MSIRDDSNRFQSGATRRMRTSHVYHGLPCSTVSQDCPLIATGWTVNVTMLRSRTCQSLNVLNELLFPRADTPCQGYSPALRCF